MYLEKLFNSEYTEIVLANSEKNIVNLEDEENKAIYEEEIMSEEDNSEDYNYQPVYIEMTNTVISIV